MFKPHDAHGGFGGIGGCHQLTPRELSEDTSSLTHTCIVCLTNIGGTSGQTHQWDQTHQIKQRATGVGDAI